jgi:hypothetical protein
MKSKLQTTKNLVVIFLYNQTLSSFCSNYLDCSSKMPEGISHLISGELLAK